MGTTFNCVCNKKKWVLFPFSPLLLWNSKNYNKSVGTFQTGIFRNSNSILHKHGKYPLHTYCGGTRLCIRSSLLCELVSLRVAITN